MFRGTFCNKEETYTISDRCEMILMELWEALAPLQEDLLFSYCYYSCPWRVCKGRVDVQLQELIKTAEYFIVLFPPLNKLLPAV